MNFRLPFQISRISAICQSSSAVNLISKFTPIYRNYVKTQNKDKQNSTYYARIFTNKCRYRTIHSPFNIYQQNALIHNIADTEEAVKQRVRYEQGCDCQMPEEPELAFRQTTKICCFPCIDHKPCIAPPLVRPPKSYDDSKCLYRHTCKPDLCNIDPPRMDDLCCVQVERKKLPPLKANSCCFCMDKKPMIAPPLCPPEKLYDPDKMKWKHKFCEEPKCIRMDDACGFKVLQKELPAIPCNNCKPCLNNRPLTAPNLIRPVLRYDPTCIPYPHTTCPCEPNPLRRDSCLCEPMRDLPPMPCSDCMPCQPHVPTVCPLLKRLEARYDSSDMKYDHKCPQTPCDTPALRRDNNIISVTLTRKKLPQLREDETCKQCMEYRPLTAPELGRPPLYNNGLTEEQKRVHCIEEKCERRDGEIIIWRKCLPPAPISDCCKPCMDNLLLPCTQPNFVPPKKLYDDTTCKYRHICVPKRCENPPRMDDIKCYKDGRKKLPKPPNSPDCKPCMHHPKTAPVLCRPEKCYDDTKQKYKHPECPEDPCKVIPRADDFTGIKDEVKNLQTYKPLKCVKCMPYVPCRAPALHRPRARYNDTCMLYKHNHCPPKEESIFRRDQYLWEGPRKLPKVECGTICQQCQVYYPTTAPYLRRPVKLYEFPHDPVRVKDCPQECPPRRDDLLCWKPKRKKLPSFKDCDQCCYYSTKTNVKYNFSTKHVSNLDKLPKKQKLYKSKNCNDPQKQIGQSSTKTNHVQSEPRYYVEEPTWKCIDVSKVGTNKTNTKKKYDYSVEKWLREGAEQKVEATSKSKSHRRHKHAYNRFDIHSKYTTGSECITPVKFTGFDTSEGNIFIKKNDKLQPLKIGNAILSDELFRTSDNRLYNKTQIKSAICESGDINSSLNKNKSTTSSVPQKSKEHYAYSTIIQERIKQQIVPASNTPTSNCILRLSNQMRSTLFQKISNFFKHRENIAKHQKILDAFKNRPGIIFERNKLKKELIANVCEKYDIELNLNKLKTEKNKPYFVQKYKKQKFNVEMEKSAMCCSSKLTSKKGESSKTRRLPKKIKMNQIRNFSTNSNTGPLYYKHIDISDDYIGKIYKVKLKKIGVKNLMLEKNDPDKINDEPHTICYICKVVPRYQPIVDDDPPDIENVKFNFYKEKRNTIE